MNKGTIVLVPFPFTDLSGSKVRPCLILYEQAKGEDCVVCFISSLKPKKLGLGEVRVRATSANGLKTASVIKTTKIATLQKKIILGALGRLEPVLLKAVDAQLRGVFALR